MSNTDRDSLLERWADGMEKLEQYYENLYGPPATPATLPDVTNTDGMLAAIADELERAKDNINKKSSVYHDTTSAYTKTVPAYVHRAIVEALGGNSVSEDSALLSAAVTQIISKDSSNNVLQTYAVPADVQALDGYGWGSGTTEIYYNYIDFVNKKYVQNVGEIVFDGTQTAIIYDVSVYRRRGIYEVDNVKPFSDPTSNVIDPGIISSYLPPSSNNATYAGGAGVFRRNNGSSQIVVCFDADSGITNSTTLNQYLTDHPLTVHYPLDEPIVTDISEYLVDDNTMDVESGGTLTFDNSNNLAVPSTELFIVDVSGES